MNLLGASPDQPRGNSLLQAPLDAMMSTGPTLGTDDTEASRHSARLGDQAMTRAIIVAALLLAAATGSRLVAGTALAKELAPTSFGADTPTVGSDVGPTSFRTVARTVDFGADLVLSRLTFWNSACNARGFTVTVTQPPANGTVSVTEGLNTANANPKFGTAGRCGGMQIVGKQILYRSTPGFRGTDVVIYEYISDRGERSRTTVNIAVR